jgi:hypothetical protein
VSLLVLMCVCVCVCAYVLKCTRDTEVGRYLMLVRDSGPLLWTCDVLWICYERV